MALHEVPEKKISRRIDITLSPEDGETAIVVDGVDTTYWIAREPVIIKASTDGTPQVTVTLAAPELNIIHKGH